MVLVKVQYIFLLNMVLVKVIVYILVKYGSC